MGTKVIIKPYLPVIDLHNFGITPKMLIRGITVQEYGRGGEERWKEAMNDLKPVTSPETPAKIGERLEEINSQIQDSQSFYKKVKGWSSNLLGAGIGLGLIVLLTPIKIPLLFAAAAFSLIGWGVTKLVAESSAENIVKLQQTREELLTSHEQKLTAPAPLPAPAAKKAGK